MKGEWSPSIGRGAPADPTPGTGNQRFERKPIVRRAGSVVRYGMVGALLVGGSSHEAQAQAPSGAPSPAETADAFETGRTPAGHNFVVPTSWTVSRREHAVLLEAPERDSWIALIETDAEDAPTAIASGWKRYTERPLPDLLLSVPLPNRNGWLDGRVHSFRVAAGEPRQLSARALRRGSHWVVRIDDLANAVAGKRAAELSLIREGFVPAGYVRESFAGRKARVLDPRRIEALKTFVSRSRALLDVPGVSLGIVQGGKVVFAGGFGVRQVGKPEVVDADTLYPIASNTKSLTTLMLAKLIEEGRFTWTTPVVDLMPEFELADAETTRRVEVGHLSCACAGLPYRNLDWEFAAPDSPASLAFQILARMRPTSAFGSSYQYSNPPAAAGGFLGGHVAYPELELGRAYDRAMHTRVFAPLGMTRTTFDFDRAMRGNFARSHGIGIDGALALIDPRRDRQMHAVRPTGGAWSNVNDLLAYVKLELSGGLLSDGRRHISKQALQERWRPRVSTGRSSWYGLGLDTDVSSGTPMMFHGGRLYGQRSNMVWWPEHDLGLVVLMNASTGNVLMDAFPRKLMEVVFDGQPEADSMVDAAAAGERERRLTAGRGLDYPPKAEQAERLATRYRNQFLGELRVRKSHGQVRFHFQPWEAPVAARASANGSVEFVLAIPSPPPALIAGVSEGRRTLTLRDAQNEYVFVESGDAK